MVKIIALIRWHAILALVISMGCTNYTMSFTFEGKQVEAGIEDKPVGQGSLQEALLIDDISPDYTESSSANEKRLAVMGWSEDVQKDIKRYKEKIERIKEGPLHATIENLYYAHQKNRKDHADKVDVVVKAYWDDYTRMLEAEMAAADEAKTDYDMKVVQQEQNKAKKLRNLIVKAIVGVFTGGGVGSVLAVPDTADLLFGSESNKKITKPEIPSENEIIRSASKKAGLGRMPEHGLQSLGGKLFADIIGSDIAVTSSHIRPLSLFC